MSELMGGEHIVLQSPFMCLKRSQLPNTFCDCTNVFAQVTSTQVQLKAVFYILKKTLADGLRTTRCIVAIQHIQTTGFNGHLSAFTFDVYAGCFPD